MEIIPYMDPMGNNSNLEVCSCQQVVKYPSARCASSVCWDHTSKTHFVQLIPWFKESWSQTLETTNFSSLLVTFPILTWHLKNDAFQFWKLMKKRCFDLTSASSRDFCWRWNWHIFWKKNTPSSCCKRIPSDNCGTSSDEIPKPRRSSRQVTICLPLSYHWVLFKQCLVQCFTVENEG